MSDFIWVTALRILTALTVLIVPLPAFWLSGHIDRWDWTLLGVAGASEHRQHVYQYWDKSLDTFTLAIACVVALSWKDPLVRRLAVATFAWRLAGVGIFLATGEQAVLVVFPDVFGKLFLFYLVYRVFSRQDLMLRSRADAVLTMVALVLPKIAEEYFIHVASRPWQTVTLLPAAVSTPDREYWLWMPIMLALPVLAMIRLLLLSRKTSGEARIPIVTALLGRQVSGVSGKPSVPNIELADQCRTAV